MFTRATQTWFDDSFSAPTEVQRRGWEAIRGGGHALLVAPTGSGKTLAAFLAAIDDLLDEGGAGDSAPSRKGGEEDRSTRVLYVSPLKALVYDIERNLRAPLSGIRRTAERLGLEVPHIRVSVRTGDTPSRERRLQARDPGQILVTTPESLFLILGSQARSTLRGVRTVIVDEIHALAPTKRGTHLALSLERLSEIAVSDPQRIGLSATVRPCDEIAHFLGGSRTVEIVDASARPRIDLWVTVPVPDMTNVGPPPGSAPASGPDAGRPAEAKSEAGAGLAEEGCTESAPDPEDRGGPILAELYESEPRPSFTERGLWPAIYPEILDQIRANRSTIVFVNSRGLCERLAQRLNDLAGEETVRAHHGSISHEKRREIEEALKEGRLRGIVATSSLELGIDMGAVDLVVLVESPGSVARGLQRVGRAGHRVGETSTGRLYPKHRGDLLECAVICRQMLAGEIESTRVPHNTLDVLAQQIVAICCDRERTSAGLEELVRRAWPFRDLSRAALESVLDMLSGRYPSAEFADLRPLLAWDRARDLLSPRRAAPIVSRMNPGTIPDRGLFPVFLGEKGPRVGELDEEMVYESRTGDRILLGATTWRVEDVQKDRVLVSPAPGEPGRLPFWKGEGPGRPIEVGRSLGAFLRDLSQVPADRAADWIMERTPFDRYAAENLAAYVEEQLAHAGAVPTDRAVVIERFRDELGDWRVCILTPFGSRVHAPWAMAIQRRLSGSAGFETQTLYSDDGIVLRFADADEPPGLDALLPGPEEIEDLVTEQLPDTALFAGLFRENAVRSLLLPRRGPRRRNPLWAQRIKAQQILASVRRYPSFPVVLETYRQALRDVFDLPSLKELLRDIRMRRVQIREVETPSASPFARSLVFSYVAASMYEQDAPLAERRAQALTVDRNLLSELLGQAELRELIDPLALAEVEEELQHTGEERRARDSAELHDLLRRLGDLSEPEIRERITEAGDPPSWLAELERSRRAVLVSMAGEKRWIAAEDAGLYRDALGVMPPGGLPSSFLDPVEGPLEQIVRRFARHHGPFLPRDLALRYALRAEQVEPILAGLERSGILVRGEIRPGGVELDLCDAEVLRRIKRRTLARLRREVAPVDARTLAVFLPQWHGIGTRERGRERLLDAIAQLQGLPLAWSDLTDVILPQRVEGFSVDQLDTLSASGLIVWVGKGSLGPRNGRIALYLRDQASELLAPAEPASSAPASPSDPEETILRLLEERGASFQTGIEAAVNREHPRLRAGDFETCLWNLVWAGRITNDTFGLLEDLRWPSRRFTSRRRTTLAARGGRWWRVDELYKGGADQTARALAWARLLLDRYGIVSREVARAEDLPDGYGPLYQVLKAMEESGQVRRGYFVEGMAGIQFAQTGAVERLRAARPDEDGDQEFRPGDAVVLSAVDPANPFGVLRPWPANEDSDSVRPRRAAGTLIVLLGGDPLLYVAPRRKQILVFPCRGRAMEEVLPLAFAALRRLPRRTRRRPLGIERIGSTPVSQSPYVEILRRCGFQRAYLGWEDTQGA